MDVDIFIAPKKTVVEIESQCVLLNWRLMALRKMRINLLRLTFIPVIFLAVFARPSWLPNENVFTDFIMELGGYLFLLAGLMIRIWCIFYIGNRKSKELVTEGPYSICRNPLYVGTFLLAIGVGLSFASPFMVLSVLVIVVPVHVITARMEETNLGTLFGEEYRMYKRKVDRFWPNFSNYTSPETLSVNVHSIRRIFFDTTGVLLLPWIEDWLELLREQGIIPVLWHSPF